MKIQKILKEDYTIIFTSYRYMLNDGPLFSRRNWEVLCIDECDRLKNRGTKFSQQIYKMQSNFNLLLSGTPIQNKLGDLWNLIFFIDPMKYQYILQCNDFKVLTDE